MPKVFNPVFVILDTNHFSELARQSSAGQTLQRRIEDRQADVFVTVITGQEAFEGWLAHINRLKPGLPQTRAYADFLDCLHLLVKFTILPFDEDAARIFHRLQEDKIRTGKMDLKIAAIGLAHEATVPTRNAKDFDKVPGLRVENWLD